ncbi:MAG: FtsW/RodA/SpoVE family cell cycle protein [Verrucomicrobiota bacterium]
MNWALVLTMYGLLVFGVFSIESAARHLPQGGEWYAEKQKMWIMLGSVVYFGVSLTNYRWFRWLSPPLFVVAIGATLLAQENESGVHQLTLPGGVDFQPVQLLLLAGILASAWLLQDLPRLGRKIPKVGWLLEEPIVKIVSVGLMTGLPFLLVVKLGDMGSALVWLPVAFVLMLAGGVPFRYLSFMLLIGAAALPMLYYVVLPEVSDRGPQRIETYLDMLHGREVDTQDEAYAAHRVSMAVGKAGWSGVGWNAPAERGSIHAKRMIPTDTAHNDYIFSVIAEEQGFRGSMLLVTGFGLLLVTCLFIAAYAMDPMGRIIVCGVVGVFFAHVFENIGMCVLITPITGIPLPLISYSGTFVVICMFLLGLVQSVWVHRKPIRVTEEKEEPEAQAPGLMLPSRDL